VATAQEFDRSAADAEPSVYLITVGPGERVWERFGHNALWISEQGRGVGLAYNWGMFSFDQPGFLPRLVRGRMLYWMASFQAERMIAAYRADDRSVWVQELALTPEQTLELQEALRINAFPENAYYRYDYYRDNCSTRVRDALDRVLGGRLRARLTGVPTGSTYRWHTRRLLQGMPLMYTGSQLVLSQRADRPIDRWEEAFLPVQLMEGVREVGVPDGAGGEVPLVRSERQLYRAAHVPEPQSVPSYLPRYLAIGSALALLLFGLARVASAGAGWARAAVALLAGSWSLVAGAAGTVLAGAWLFTDHVFWYPNENLLQMSPLSLALALSVAPLVLRSRPLRPAVILALAIAGVSLAGFLLQPLPWLDQRNGEILALTLPANLGVAGALMLLWRAEGARRRG